ncbi:hypothetical protein D9M71_812740 [compost metagenome]
MPPTTQWTKRRHLRPERAQTSYLIRPAPCLITELQRHRFPSSHTWALVRQAFPPEVTQAGGRNAAVDQIQVSIIAA